MPGSQDWRSSDMSVVSAPTSSVASFKQFEQQQRATHGGLAEHAMGGDWVELFYDLFFAAALAAYTSRRELLRSQDTADLAMYFTILWWTWASQTMYDVRFARIGSGEKVLKFVQLILLIGYGVFQDELSIFVKPSSGNERGAYGTVPGQVLPRRRTDPSTSAIGIAVIFILSRLQLGSQYLYIAYSRLRTGKSTKKTIVWHYLLPFISALLWLISLAVINQQSNGIHVARTALWVSGILIEALGNLCLRAYEHGGFEHTEIVERLGALTVVLLGEGVIKLVRFLRDIKTGIGFTYKSGLAITSSVISIYLLWAIYFDHLNPHVKIGKMKAYAFIYLHFLFHFALVLFLEGATGLLLWTNIDSGIKVLLDSDTNFGQAVGVLEDLFDLKFDKNNTLSIGKLDFVYRIEDGQMLKVKDVAKSLHDAASLPQHLEAGARSLHKRSTPDSHVSVLAAGIDPKAPENIPSRVGQVLTEHEYNYVFVNIFGKLAASYRVEPSHFYLEYVDSLVPSQTTAALAQHAYTLLAQQFRLAAKFVIIAGGILLLLNVPLMRIVGRHDAPNWSRYLPIGSRVSTGAMLVLFGGIADIQNYAVHKYDPMRQTVLGALMGSATLVPMWTATALLVYLLDILTRRYFQFWPRRYAANTSSDERHVSGANNTDASEKAGVKSSFGDPFSDTMSPVTISRVPSARSSLQRPHVPATGPAPVYNSVVSQGVIVHEAPTSYGGAYERSLYAGERGRKTSSNYGSPSAAGQFAYGVASERPTGRSSAGSHVSSGGRQREGSHTSASSARGRGSDRQPQTSSRPAWL